MEEKLKEILEKYTPSCNQILEEVLQKYHAVTDAISEDDFQEFEAAFEKLDLAIQKDKFVEKFKKNLYESIKSQITTNWERIGINDKLKLLLYYKGQSSSDEKQFRPTGRTAEEQLRHLEVKALLKKKQCYENYIAYNKEQLTEMIGKVQEARDFFNNFSRSRNELSAKIEKDEKLLAEQSKTVTKVALDIPQWSP